MSGDYHDFAATMISPATQLMFSHRFSATPTLRVVQTEYCSHDDLLADTISSQQLLQPPDTESGRRERLAVEL